MSRTLRLLLLTLFLILVGLWPAAAAPISLAATGAAVIITAIPGPVLLLAGFVAWWLGRQRTPKPVTA